MSGILHLPQGGAQVIIDSTIPEVPIEEEEVLIDTQVDTIGSYTYVIEASDGSYRTAKAIWESYDEIGLSYVKDPMNSNQAIFNQNKHNGLNFIPTLRYPEQKLYTQPSFMFINKLVRFASKRVIAQIQVDEGSWAHSLITLYFVPYNSKVTLKDEIDRVKAIIAGGTDAGVVHTSIPHNGAVDQNDLKGISVFDLLAAGWYKIAVKLDSNQGPGDESTPTLYSLGFRTY